MFSIFKLLFFYFPKMSIENKKAKSSKPVTRKLIKKELCNDESGKNAIYYYEIYSDDGELINTQKVISRSKTFANKYKEEEHKKIVLDTAIKFFNDQGIKKSSLYKLSFLNLYLKECVKYILDTANIKITQRKLKQLIKVDYLEMDP